MGGRRSGHQTSTFEGQEVCHFVSRTPNGRASRVTYTQPSKRRFSLGLDVRWRLLGNRNPPLHVVSRQLLRIPVPTNWHKFQLFLAIHPISVASHLGHLEQILKRQITKVLTTVKKCVTSLSTG